MRQYRIREFKQVWESGPPEILYEAQRKTTFGWRALTQKMFGPGGYPLSANRRFHTLAEAESAVREEIARHLPMADRYHFVGEG